MLINSVIICVFFSVAKLSPPKKNDCIVFPKDDTNVSILSNSYSGLFQSPGFEQGVGIGIAAAETAVKHHRVLAVTFLQDVAAEGLRRRLVKQAALQEEGKWYTRLVEMAVAQTDKLIEVLKRRSPAASRLPLGAYRLRFTSPGASTASMLRISLTLRHGADAPSLRSNLSPRRGAREIGG